MSYCNNIITVGSRESPLSQAQVQEVYNDLKQFHPHIKFKKCFLKTTGDIDRSTSLKNVVQTDFFTKEIDLMQLAGHFRISIHSAKDLPNPLAKGLKIAALTKGVDSSDVLVLRENETLETLSPHAKIATSSLRREENIRSLKKNVVFVDVRGYIAERLEKLYCGEVDGVVIAEAALIRLKLTHLNRLFIPGECAPLQGRLAVVIQEEDQAMFDLFHCLDYSD